MDDNRSSFKLGRREILKSAGAMMATAAVNPTLLSATPSEKTKNRRIIFRADDVGYTPVYNIGIFRCVDEGVVTHIELMLDSMGAVDAMEKLRERPWLSVGWHDHWFGSPVTDPKHIPSLLDDTGRFRFRYRNGPEDPTAYRGVKYDEALIECRAQIERCIKVMGKAPDITWLQKGQNVVEEARQAACDEYGIAYDTGTKESPQSGKVTPVEPRFADCDVFAPVMSGMEKIKRSGGDYLEYFKQDPDHLADHKAPIVVFHPGFMDVYMLADNTGHILDPLGKFYENRFLCSQGLKQWIFDNKIELINHRDAIYGTRDYQNHLKESNSPLAV